MLGLNTNPVYLDNIYTVMGQVKGSKQRGKHNRALISEDLYNY